MLGLVVFAVPLRNPFFFFNDTATTEIYTLSLHDALPISPRPRRGTAGTSRASTRRAPARRDRSEEHTSELQSRRDLVCRLLLEQKNTRAVSNRHVGGRGALHTHIAHTCLT